MDVCPCVCIYIYILYIYIDIYIYTRIFVRASRALDSHVFKSSLGIGIIVLRRRHDTPKGNLGPLQVPYYSHLRLARLLIKADTQRQTYTHEHTNGHTETHAQISTHIPTNSLTDTHTHTHTHTRAHTLDTSKRSTQLAEKVGECTTRPSKRHQHAPKMLSKHSQRGKTHSDPQQDHFFPAGPPMEEPTSTPK